MVTSLITTPLRSFVAILDAVCVPVHKVVSATDTALELLDEERLLEDLEELDELEEPQLLEDEVLDDELAEELLLDELLLEDEQVIPPV